MLLSRFLVHFPQPKVSRRVVVILSGRLLVSAEGTAVVLSPQIEVADLDALPWGCRREIEGLLPPAVVRENPLCQNRYRQERQEKTAKKKNGQKTTHVEIFHPRRPLVNRVHASRPFWHCGIQDHLKVRRSGRRAGLRLRCPGACPSAGTVNVR